MFTPTESGRIAVDARNARSLLDTELVVYSATRRRLARNTNYGATTDSHVELNVTAGQTYYLAVSGSHRSVGAYDLTVDYLSVVAAGDTSSRLQVPSRTEGRFDTPTEVDSYVFTPTVAGRLGIKVGALSGGVQTTVQIFDAGGTVLAKSSNDPLTKVSFLNYEVTAGQQYEIRILNKSRKIGDYALEVDYLLGGAV